MFCICFRFTARAVASRGRKLTELCLPRLAQVISTASAAAAMPQLAELIKHRYSMSGLFKPA